MIGTGAPLKRVATIKARVGWKGLTSDEFELRSHAYLVTGRDFRGKYIDWKTCYQVSEDRYNDDPLIQLRNRDILVTKDGTIGKVAVVDGLDKPACLNSGVFVVRPRRDLDASYLYWILQSEVFSAFIAEVSRGSTIQHLYQEEFREMRVPLRELEEQRVIADYLDRETAQIDAFIAKNEELITLLTERRAGIIANTVTSGVGQNVSLVESDVDWIGPTPSHWEVRPLRWSARIRTGTTPAGERVFADEPGEPWIRPDDLDVSGSASVASRWLTPEGAAQGRPAAPGATLVCTIGATLGKAGRVETASYFNQQITSVKWTLNDEFLFWLFVAAREPLARLSVGNTLPILNNDKLAGLRIPVPPRGEQGQIVDYIRAQTARIDAATKTARRGIELARERRAALISAAVTGKINVGVAA